jgi:hypothetical protein
MRSMVRSTNTTKTDVARGATVRGRTMQRKCACGQHAAGGHCGACKKASWGALGVGEALRDDQNVARADQATTGSKQQAAPATVRETLRSPGTPLDTATQAFFGSRFGYDFSTVRLHADSHAENSARSIGAFAFAAGEHVALGNEARKLAPSPRARMLGHELAHVVQQRSGVISPRSALSLASSEFHEREAHASARAISAGASRAPALSVAPTQVMRLTPQEFKSQLEQTPDETKAIEALFTNTTFLALWNYMKACPATPKRDLGPLALDVKPGLVIGGKERFGGFFGGTPPTLKINPTKPEHQANPAELVDTIVHELIHAVDDLQPGCKAAGAGDAPLAGSATATLPRRDSVKGTAAEDKFTKEQGPGASNPCEEFIDINAAAQDLVTQVIKADIQASGVGRPTITFVNEIIRHNPQAMVDYKACRDIACAKKQVADRDNAIAACTAQILNRYYVPPPNQGVKAPPPDAPKFGPLFKPRRDFNDKMQQSTENL